MYIYIYIYIYIHTYILEYDMIWYNRLSYYTTVRRRTLLSPWSVVRERGSAPKGGRHSTIFFPADASVLWQPDVLTIYTKKLFLGAGFRGAPPISLTKGPLPRKRHGRSANQESLSLNFWETPYDLPVSEKKTPLRKRTTLKVQAFGVPSRGLEGCFCLWTAGRGLAQKELLVQIIEIL